MAEDAVVGFRFNDMEELKADARVEKAAELMFSEMTMDHFGKRAEVEPRADARIDDFIVDFNDVEDFML